MSQYFPQEPQRPQQQDPYSTYNPYNPYNSEPTYVTPQSQPPSPYAQPPSPYAQTQAQQSMQPPYVGYVPSNVGSAVPVTGKKLSARIWQAIVQFLGVRGVVVAAGALLAGLAFFILPFYSNYTAYFLAKDTLDDKWWLELLLALVPLLIVIGFPVVERIRQHQRRWSLIIAGSGILGVLFNYWFLDAIVGSDYWRFGAWSYFLGMALVAIGGISLFLWKKR